MRNLDKVWDKWQDLDATYAKTSVTKKEFLCTLVASGARDKVNAILAKIANDIVSAEDNKKFSVIQAGMLALLNNYNNLADDISSINGYIRELTGIEPSKKTLSFDALIDLISVGRPYVVPAVEFDISPVGMELITASSIHKVKLVSCSAVMIPAWLRDLEQLDLSDSDFHKRVIAGFRKLGNVKRPVLLMDKKTTAGVKCLTLKKNIGKLECGETEIEVRLI